MATATIQDLTPQEKLDKMLIKTIRSHKARGKPLKWYHVAGKLKRPDCQGVDLLRELFDALNRVVEEGEIDRDKWSTVPEKLRKERRF